MRRALAGKARVTSGLFMTVIGVILLAAPAAAQKAPDETGQEVLIKSTLLTFNDANITGNYAVLHAKLSKPFRDQFSPERLQQAFKVFHDKHIDFDIIAAKKPVLTEPAKVSERGILMLHGYFPTTPVRVNFELDFIRSDGEWKAVKINVQLRKPPEQDQGSKGAPK